MIFCRIENGAISRPFNTTFTDNFLILIMLREHDRIHDTDILLLREKERTRDGKNLQLSKVVRTSQTVYKKKYEIDIGSFFKKGTIIGT